MSTICLHNFLHQTNSAAYCPTGFVETYDVTGEIKKGEWQKVVGDGQGMLLENIDPLRGCRPTNSAIGVRDFSKNERQFVRRFTSLAMGSCKKQRQCKGIMKSKKNVHLFMCYVSIFVYIMFYFIK